MIAAIVLLFELALIIFMIASIWRVFTKAGQPGWAAIIPLYNVYVLLKIVGKPGWWLILCLVPLVNIIIGIIIGIELAKVFGKGAGFGIGLVFLGFIFYPILGFGDAVYEGSATPA